MGDKANAENFGSSLGLGNQKTGALRTVRGSIRTLGLDMETDASNEDDSESETAIRRDMETDASIPNRKRKATSASAHNTTNNADTHWKDRVSAILGSDLVRCDHCKRPFSSEDDIVGGDYPRSSMSVYAETGSKGKNKGTSQNFRVKNLIKCNHTICLNCVNDQVVLEADESRSGKGWKTGYCRCPVIGCQAINAFSPTDSKPNVKLAKLIEGLRKVEEEDPNEE
jgi:hypothetical protein